MHEIFLNYTMIDCVCFHHYLLFSVGFYVVPFCNLFSFNQFLLKNEWFAKKDHKFNFSLFSVLGFSQSIAPGI